jgi:hypothetical protein
MWSNGFRTLSEPLRGRFRIGPETVAYLEVRCSMISFSKLLRFLFLVVAVFAFVGCSSDSDRSRVQGSVSYNGEPVDDGGIGFLPEGEGASQVRATGEIHDGRYDLDSTCGPYPGKYRVEIYWNKKTGKQLANRDRTAFKDERKQAIPPKYNENTELEVTIKPGRNTKDFVLKP